MGRLFAAAVLATALCHPAFAQAPGPVRSITHVAGGLYRFQEGLGFGVFLVTADGIVVVDPISTAAATWLKGELESRFDAPVTHVVYSHHHFDHASGAAVFEGATVVGHAATAANLAPPPAGAPLPSVIVTLGLDPDGDGLVPLAGAPPFVASLLGRGDENGDGAVDGREAFIGLYADVRAPDQTFSAPYDLTVGGSTIRLVPVGGAHASDTTYVLFPEERAVFVVDVINIKRLPFADIADYEESDQAAMFDAALALDWDTIIPGHGDIGTRDDLLAFRQYLSDLQAGVQAGIDAGQSLEAIQSSLLLERYRDWGAYDMRPLNIAGMYAYLTR